MVVVSQAGSEPATGTVHLDVRLDRLSLVRKLSTHLTARLGGVLIVSLAGALFAALLGRFFTRLSQADTAISVSSTGLSSGSQLKPIVFCIDFSKNSKSDSSLR